MTFDLHESFLDCVKNQSMSIDSRVDNLRQLVKSLPKENQVLLSHITQHLGKKMKKCIFNLFQNYISIKLNFS